MAGTVVVRFACGFSVAGALVHASKIVVRRVDMLQRHPFRTGVQVLRAF